MPTFITPTQFLVRYDFRWVGKNITDTGIAATAAECITSPVILAFIDEASEMVMGAAAVGARYSVDDLLTYGGSLLVRIVSDLTMGLILKRRGRAIKDEDALSKPYMEALDYLEQLRRGERIFFDVPNVPEAGLPGTGDMNPVPGINPPLPSQIAVRYFGYPMGGYGPWGWGGGYYGGW